MTPPSCRLFVIPAQAAATAIILRRGPSDWYHLIRWDMGHDTFQAGSWFHGRIYEEKCDLSPDGNLFLYFAFKHIHVGNQSVDSYTALSRAPWLHALVIWPQGTTYGGGGRFLGHRRIALRGVLGDPFPELPDGLEIVEGETDVHCSTEMTEVVAGADWAAVTIVDAQSIQLAESFFGLQRTSPSSWPTLQTSIPIRNRHRN